MENDQTFISSVSGTQRQFAPGDIIDGSYKLGALLGCGGMGSVFACRHTALGKDYAIKMLHGDKLSAEQWERFQMEAKALALLNHSGIVGIHNMGIDNTDGDGGQYPYYVMDLLSGESLADAVTAGGGIPVMETLEYFIKLADALALAHSKGIIHRDVKPANVMVERRDGKIANVKLVDFGIARLSRQGFGDQSQTATGLIFGTPFYMSPEQCQGKKVDERSDIYSLGCALFECLTGRPPFQGENAFQTFMMHQSKEPPRLKEAKPDVDFPPALERAVGKMLAKAPENRYQSMTQVRHDFERIRDGKPVGTSNSVPAIEAASEGNEESDSKRSKLGLMITGLAAVVLLVCGTIAWGVSNMGAKPITTSTNNDSGDELYERLKQTKTFLDIKVEEPKLKTRLEKYRQTPQSSAPLMQMNPPRLVFPSDFIIGAVRFSDGKIVRAVGTIPVPEGQKVTLVLTKFIDRWPEFFSKLGTDSITGLELRTAEPSKWINELASVKSLEELSFFNTLLKAVIDQHFEVPKDMDNEAQNDESPLRNQDLILLDAKLPGLKVLGLCGIHVSGGAIAKMRLLKTIHTLKLKRVADIEGLLRVLPECDNIRELWLIGQGTNDEDVAVLSRMKNLEVLHIGRGRCSSRALLSFAKMKSLKALYLDRVPVEWSEKVNLPIVMESAEDNTYWKYVPDTEKN